MVKRMKKFLPLLLYLPLVSCQQRSTDLTGNLLFTASGTFDAQADTRRREGKGIRSVEWQSRPPVPASEVRVVYDSDARTLAWHMTLKNPTFNPGNLPGSAPRNVSTYRGNGTLFTRGQLKGVLLVQSGPQEYTLLTRAYAQQQDTAYLPAFNGGQ